MAKIIFCFLFWGLFHSLDETVESFDTVISHRPSCLHKTEAGSRGCRNMDEFFPSVYMKCQREAEGPAPHQSRAGNSGVWSREKASSQSSISVSSYVTRNINTSINAVYLLTETPWSGFKMVVSAFAERQYKNKLLVFSQTVHYVNQCAFYNVVTNSLNLLPKGEKLSPD